jgi:hypothetical protein
MTSREHQELHQTQAEIARTRERLSASLGALKHDLGSLTDWRTWVRERPLPFLAGALALGAWLGSRR